MTLLDAPKKVNRDRSHFPRWLLLGCCLVLLGCGGKQSEAPIDPRAAESTPEWQPVAAKEEQRPVPVFEPVPITPLEMEPEFASNPGPVVQTVYRPSDSRPRYDEKRVKELGIGRYASKRLILYTDIDPEVAKTLPPLVDQLYDAWIAYFGELPPNREGTEYQMTGYLLKDQDRFRAAGMLPEDLPYFEHGRHRGAEFWLNEQEYDYYRRHLLFHEATHCFMTTMPGKAPTTWYLEGMAEYFGTHSIDENGMVTFGVMPAASQDVTGFGRVQMIQDEVAAGRFLTLQRAAGIGNVDFNASRSIPYAWSWALCKFLETHPRYHDRFHELGQHLVGEEFYDRIEEFSGEDDALLEAEWSQFIHDLEYGFDLEANAFVLAPSQPLTTEVTVQVLAEHGWQAAGIDVAAGNTYSLNATGQVTLATQPKPWISEASGITILYANGTPIGTLQVAVLGSTGTFDVQNAGTSLDYSPEYSGALFFRVNDFPSERDDNSGAYSVRISEVH